MTVKPTQEELKNISTAEGDAAVMSKSSLTPKDIKDEIAGDKSNVQVKDYSPTLGRIILWVFSLLVFITGIFVMVLTVYTLVGIILGIVMMAAGVILPFTVGGDWMKKYVE